MDQDKRRPSQIIKEWWSVAVIGVAIVGGYLWLEQNFAKVEKLEAEKCNLSYEIRITKAEIEFDGVDENLDLNRNELEALLQIPDRPEELVEFKKNFIEELEIRSRNIKTHTDCLDRAQIACLENDTNIGKCYD